MFGHLLVSPVEHRFVAAGMDDCRLGIVGDRDPGHPAIELVGMAMPRDPGGQLLIGEGLHKGLVAGPQHGDEQRSFPHRLRTRAANGHGLASPIDKHLFPWHMDLTQAGLQRAGPPLIQLAKPAIAIALGLGLVVFLPH